MTITIELLENTIETLNGKRHSTQSILTTNGHSHLAKGTGLLNELMRSLIGIRPTPETPEEIAKLKDALTHLDSDVGRGNGSIFDSNGSPVEDHWLGVVWAMRSLGWDCGKEIAREWSMQSDRYTDDGFDKAWNSYDSNKPNAIGVGSLYKLAMNNGWILNSTEQLDHHEEAEQTINASKFKLLSGADLHRLKPTLWIVKGLFPSEGLAALYGPSGSGKSFLAFGLAAAIAEGTEWFDMKVTASPVVYVALEGEGGYKNRLAAWEHQNKKTISSGLKFVLQPFKLTSMDDVEELSRVLPKHSVVIIDTLNRAAPTTDENSSKEMGVLLECCKALQAKINGLIILIAHTGKDTSRGLRGHSSLFAALDGAIEIVKTNDNRAWEIAKAKDGVDSLKFPFRLKVQHLGKDEDGDAITSCTVERDNTPLFALPEPSGKVQREVLKYLRGHIKLSQIQGKAGCCGACISFEEAVKQLAPTLLSTAKNKQINRARQLINDLVKAGFLHHGIDGDEGWLWL